MPLLSLEKPYQWQDLNETVQKHLRLNHTVRVFQTMPQAILELSISLHLLYSHKREFYHFLGLGMHAENALIFLSRQGLKGLEINLQSLPEIDEKKSLMTLIDLDDAISAKKYFVDRQEQINPKATRIWLSHHLHNVQRVSEDISDSDIIIYNFAPQIVVAVLGRRLQSLTPPVAPTLNWPAEISLSWGEQKENQAWVEQVEKQKWGGGEPLLATSDQRIYDRALLYWSDIEASALVDELISQGISKEDVDSVGFSRWNEPKILAQFERLGWSPEVFRGTLVFSCRLSQNNKFKEILTSCVQSLRSKSQF